LPCAAHAQSKYDTLKNVNIITKTPPSTQDKINSFSAGRQIKTLDSQRLKYYQLQSLATLLEQESNVFLHSYGFNSLATLNIRGSSAAQSLVLWNGVPVQNSSLGIADVSLMPLAMFNKVNLLYGSSAALLGSGNVGGAVSLENETPYFDTAIRLHTALSLGAGYFANYSGAIHITCSSPKWFGNLILFAAQAQNNFTYLSDSGTTKTLANARLKSFGTLATLSYKPNIYNTLSLSFWYQYGYRQIPPALFEENSLKNYSSTTFRLLADFEHHKNKSLWYSKSSFSKDDMQYADPGLITNSGTLQSTMGSWQVFQELGYKQWLGNRQSLLLFVPLQLNVMPFKDSTRTQSSVALAAAYQYQWNHIGCSINARQEWRNNNAIALGGLGLYYSFNLNFTLRANIQSTYRNPTLNELYYFPGGNAALKPEKGWSCDAGYAFAYALTKKLRFSQELSAYSRDIKDWILWLGAAVWTPHNIAEVLSRGLETDNALTYYYPKGRIRISLLSNYCIATTVSSYIPNDGSIGKQIPYTPRYNFRAMLMLYYKRFYISYDQSYTGYRFYTTDESLYLTPYALANIKIAYDIPLGTHYYSLSANLNNLYNSSYQLAAGRPMPGINAMLMLKVNL
jgi:iron complex outermembrane receptor protein